MFFGETSYSGKEDRFRLQSSWTESSTAFSKVSKLRRFCDKGSCGDWDIVTREVAPVRLLLNQIVADPIEGDHLLQAVGLLVVNLLER